MEGKRAILVDRYRTSAELHSMQGTTDSQKRFPESGIERLAMLTHIYTFHHFICLALDTRATSTNSAPRSTVPPANPCAAADCLS